MTGVIVHVSCVYIEQITVTDWTLIAFLSLSGALTSSVVYLLYLAMLRMRISSSTDRDDALSLASHRAFGLDIGYTYPRSTLTNMTNYNATSAHSTNSLRHPMLLRAYRTLQQIT